jgi:hypothetical protein
MEEPDLSLQYDGPTLTKGAVTAIAILRALGRVHDGDKLTPARICELIGCDEPDEHGLPPAEWLPDVGDADEDEDPKHRAAVAAVALLMRELHNAMNERGGSGVLYAQALAQLSGNLGADCELDEKVLHDNIRACYEAAKYERSLH